MQTDDLWRPRLVSRARLKFDSIANQQMLLFPEAALLLNETGAAIMRLCDGEHLIDQIVTDLALHYDSPDRDNIKHEVEEFLGAIRARGLLQ
jgi:pyrroloquinoline quinone biosynthesis protein D